jgi:DNA-binding NarL/FixJ family response regulator
MRQLIATGRGKDLLQMSHIVGDSSTTGVLKRQTVDLIGLTADFQYEAALSLIEEMVFTSKGTELEDFIGKFVSAVEVYIDFATGRTEDLEKNYLVVRRENDKQLDLGIADKISILRTMSSKELIYDNASALFRLRQDALDIAGADKSSLVLYLLQGIEAATLISEGEFKDALVVANNVISQAERNGYTGIFGPLDAMYVRARCLLEFAKTEAAQKEFERIRNLAATWRQYSWKYIAESFLARDLALNGESAAALEIVRNEREQISNLNLKNGLVAFADLTELFIRYTMKDWDRVGILLSRLPEFLLVKRIRPIYQSQTGKKNDYFSFTELPSENAKDQIYKYLAEAEENIDREALALEAMRKALRVGARVGAKETFLRQGAEVLNLIIKIAGEQPTVYLEELTSAITARLKQRSANAIGLRASLTKRELEILHHLATGNPISSISTSLHVSQNTMKTHLKNIYRKLDATGRDDAVVKAKTLYIL